MTRIGYLVNARLPTEKAHGFQVMKMCEAMGDLGHDVELIHPYRHQDDPKLDSTDPFSYYGVRPTFRLRTLANLDVITLERMLPGAPFRALVRAQQLGWGFAAAARTPGDRDLVYTRDTAVAYWATLLGRPCVYEAHVAPGPRAKRMVRRLARRSATRAVVAVSGDTAERLEESGVPADKLHVLPNAADAEAFAGAPSREEARRRLGLPLDRPVVGYVGRFVAVGEEKGVPDLLRALAQPELRGLDPLLVCVGGPMDVVPRYQELARSLGLPESAYRFADRVPNAEVPVWLAALDIGAMPYPTASAAISASPIKLFEYMAAGLPIVTTDLPIVRAALNEGNALLVPPDDPAAFGRALATLIRDRPRAAALAERALRDSAGHTWLARAEQAIDYALGAA
jgi:glycosyltransferase involved in cell wall biosynthesis